MPRRRRYTKPNAKRYAAAKVDRLTGNWNPGDPDINELNASARPIISARVRQLGRDFPYFKKAMKAICDFVIGTGIKLQAKVTKPNGELNRELNREIEQGFEHWQRESDVSGQLHFWGQQRLALQSELDCGEFIFIKKHLKEPGRYLPFALQAVESSRLTDLGTAGKGNEIHQGVEYRKDTGRPVAYWFDDAEGTKPVKVPAKDVIHHFDMLRIGQKRGMTPFASAVMTSNDMGEYIDAELTGAKMAARWVGFIKPDPALSEEEAAELDEFDLENGIMERLGVNEDLILSSANRPGKTFGDFVKLLIHMLAINSDLPYEILSGDYSNISYANLKGIRNDFAKMIAAQQQRYIDYLCFPVYQEFLNQVALSGRLPLPGYFENPWQYFKAEWIPPGVESIDPLREFKAYQTAIATGLKSPQSIISAMGRDPEKVLDEIREFNQMAEQRDIVLDFGKSTATANNPAALGAK